jgi:hypothetical protein
MLMHDKLVQNKASILDKAESLGIGEVKIVIPSNSSYPSLLIVDIDESSTQLQQYIQDLGFIGVDVLPKSALKFLIKIAQGEARAEYTGYTEHVLDLKLLDSSKHDFDEYASLIGSIDL